MMRWMTAAAAVLAMATGAAAAAPGGQFRGHELAGQAKLSLDAARKIALKARPGKIVDQELEKEAGGSGLRYAFDVKSHGKTYEVGVDAQTGQVLENGTESASKEAQEVRQEKKETHH